MPQRRLILGLLALAILSAIIVRSYRREPELNGIRLSAWLQRYSESATYQARAEAREAIQEIGTNAIPCLLKAMRYEDPDWLTGLAKAVERVNIGASKLYAYRIARRKGAEMTVAGFQVLGPEAGSAIPELLALLRDTNHPATADRSGRALAGIGAPAVRPLLVELTNASPVFGRAIIQTLGRLGTNAVEAIPILIQNAQAKDPYLPRAAIGALGQMKSEALVVLPVLTNALQHQNTCVRLVAAQSVEGFAGQARPYAEALLTACNDPCEAIRVAATNGLLRIAPDLLTNTPAP